MEQKLKCAVVRDLLPNYIEKLTSEETNQEIEEHLNQCEPCTKIYEEMKTDVPTENLMTEAKDLSKFLRKTKAVSALKSGLMVLLILGIIVNVIVDLAVNRRITWSIIVIASVIVAMCTAALLIWGGKNKGLKSVTCVSILTIPLLYVIAYYCRASGYDGSWFSAVAVPVSLIWIVILWAGIFSYKVLKWNFWGAVCVSLIFAIPGNLWTNALANQVTLVSQMKSLDTMINSLAYGATAIVLFVIALIRKDKRI